MVVVKFVDIERLGMLSYQKSTRRSGDDQPAQGRSSGFRPLELLFLMVVVSVFHVETLGRGSYQKRTKRSGIDQAAQGRPSGYPSLEL